MKSLLISSVEGLDGSVAELVRTKVELVAVLAQLEEKKAALDKQFAPRVAELHDAIRDSEAVIQMYCEANREALFTEKKSRESTAAVYGFELTPYRVETSSKKVKWGDVVARLCRLPWGKAYVRVPEPRVDKEALLADREKLGLTRQLAAGITFEREEQFFIRPKSEVAEATTVKEAA